MTKARFCLLLVLDELLLCCFTLDVVVVLRSSPNSRTRSDVSPHANRDSFHVVFDLGVRIFKSGLTGHSVIGKLQ